MSTPSSKQLAAVAVFVEAFGRAKAAGLQSVNPEAAQQIAGMFAECAQLMRAAAGLPQQHVDEATESLRAELKAMAGLAKKRSKDHG